MKKINTLFALFLLISIHYNTVSAAGNYKLHAFDDPDSDAALLVAAGSYGNAQAAQEAIYHNDVASLPWKFGSYEFASQQFLIFTDENATWNGSQWMECPMVYNGLTFVYNPERSPVIFFVAPENAIYKVSTLFEYKSGDGNTQGYNFFQFKAKDGVSVINMNFGKNYTAGNRILSSDFYVNLHAGDTITFNQGATVWGDPFCEWSKITVMGNNNGASFTSAEANASGFYFDNYAVATDFSFLNAKITDAENLIGATVIGTYPANAITAFQNAINTAKDFVLNQPNATQSEINAQLTVLTEAYIEFANSYIGANNYKLFPYGETGSDAKLLVAAGTYNDVETAQKAIVHNDAGSPWKFGTYETETQKFSIYTEDANYWNGSQWLSEVNGICPIVYDGHTFVYGPDFSPVIFFVTPVSAIYKVSTKFEYQSGNGDTQGTNFFQFKAKDGASVVDMNFGKNYTAASRLIESDFFVNLYAGDTIAFNQTATLWGDPFCQWTKLQVIRDNHGVAYTSEDANASGNFFDSYAYNSLEDPAGTITPKFINVENGIRIITDKVVPVSVYDLTGVNIKTCRIDFDEVIRLGKGIYIVKVGNIVRKIVVR